MDELLTAGTGDFQTIMTESKKIKVPTYQRDYAWEKDQWEELWEDILKGMKNKNKHYMGALVFINRKGNELEVVDGQQRLTTVTILIHSVIKFIDKLIDKKIEKENNIDRKNLIKNYIGKKSSIDLTWENRLQLNEENDKFYNTYIMNNEQASNIPQKTEKTNKLLIECREYFYNKILEYVNIKEFEKDITNEKVTKIMKLVEYVVENLVFVKIIATNELSAYTIFETLNDRGIALSVTDLLKNYLLSLFNRGNDAHIAKNMWDNIIEKVEFKNFPTFLRYYWMIYNRTPKKDELFKEIKKSVKSKKTAFKLLDELMEYSEIYSALEDENSEYWDDKVELRNYISGLHILKVKQCYPLLMASLKLLDKKYHKRIFNDCEVISFRYLTICSKNPNALEDIYNNICNKISKGEVQDCTQIEEMIKPIYIRDVDFIDAFRYKVLSTKSNQKIAKYILIKLNAKISETIDYDINDSKLTIEHILPQHPSEDWIKILGNEDIEEKIYRIGNYTLLSKNSNRKIGNENYKQKLLIYKNSGIEITENISNYYEQWDEYSIDARQKYMAKFANEIWRI